MQPSASLGPPGRRRLRTLLAAALPMLLAVASGCPADDAASDSTTERDRCVEVRDHLADLRVATLDPADPAVAAAHRAQLRDALGARYLDNCVALRPERYRECVLAAATLPAVQLCETATR